MLDAKLRNANLLIGDKKEPIGRSAFPGALPAAIPIVRNDADNEISGPVHDEPGSSWHSRGYLPHFGSRTVIQHVTFQLADSLPKGVLDQLSQEIMRLPAERQEAEKRKRVEEWMDAGHGDCALSDAVIAGAVQHALLCFDGQRYRMLAWVVMPNHVHALFQPLEGWTVAKIVASWKKFTARKIFDQRRSRNADPGNANILIGEENPPIGKLTLPASSAGAAGVWHREYWDRHIRDENHFQQTVAYIHQNPVKAELVDWAEDWRWSSAGNGDRSRNDGE